MVIYKSFGYNIWLPISSSNKLRDFMTFVLSNGSSVVLFVGRVMSWRYSNGESRSKIL